MILPSRLSWILPGRRPITSISCRSSPS
jgi:hypothetical protein